MKNINIEIPDKLHKKIKLEAVMKDVSLKDFVINSLEEFVAKK